MMMSDIDLIMMHRLLASALNDLEHRQRRLERRLDANDADVWQRRLAETQAEAAALSDLQARVGQDLLLRNVLDKMWKEVYNLDE